MVYTIVVHLQAKPVSPARTHIDFDSSLSAHAQDTVEEVKAKLIEAASVYRKDKEVPPSISSTRGSYTR